MVQDPSRNFFSRKFFGRIRWGKGIGKPKRKNFCPGGVPSTDATAPPGGFLLGGFLKDKWSHAFFEHPQDISLCFKKIVQPQTQATHFASEVEVGAPHDTPRAIPQENCFCFFFWNIPSWINWDVHPSSDDDKVRPLLCLCPWVILDFCLSEGRSGCRDWWCFSSGNGSAVHLNHFPRVASAYASNPYRLQMGR